MNRREYLAARKPFTPVPGEIYENEGGGHYKYKCLRSWDGASRMRNVTSGWDFVAHGCGVYPDGRIDWDYSTDGGFANREED